MSTTKTKSLSINITNGYQKSRQKIRLDKRNKKQHQHNQQEKQEQL